MQIRRDVADNLIAVLEKRRREANSARRQNVWTLQKIAKENRTFKGEIAELSRMISKLKVKA